ncbi:hypothetical protein F5J12DRAFT_786875 [Pisolithus orientalis]|uniref:uncharacterized protein n=1 Tax=Pisolithus orientalis TaxID=936130 RepID=UPI0022255BC3|nr:uncharacterized protein F5J12DRAFT_786875 [Pisolithus orientalis]KAI5988301.1 hypothetical protein F5J12DRAFT_786875 [Pisolithus orientalis]
MPQLHLHPLPNPYPTFGKRETESATSKEDELADNIDNDEGDGEPGPSAKGPHAAGDNKPCEACAQANLVCVREPEASCKQCRKAKHKCLHSRGIGRKGCPTNESIMIFGENKDRLMIDNDKKESIALMLRPE